MPAIAECLALQCINENETRLEPPYAQKNNGVSFPCSHKKNQMNERKTMLEAYTQHPSLSNHLAPQSKGHSVLPATRRNTRSPRGVHLGRLFCLLVLASSHRILPSQPTRQRTQLPL